LALLVAVLVWLAIASGRGPSLTLSRLELQVGSVAQNLPWWIGPALVGLVACVLLAARRR
jgi:hypothetical protein